ncbi:MAG: hypothetical protein PHT95_05350, partial [Candidatus Omnitrophica bacterium]|nr:hypothetical protein [Candidatus Omnitrophota bacterium]
NLSLNCEYGMSAFRRIIKKFVEKHSLITYGPIKYSKRLEKISSAHPGVSVLMAAEVAPFYFWTGDPLRDKLTLNDWDIQFLVMGLDPRDYAGIPTLDRSGFSRYSWKSLLYLWPLAVLAFGVFSLKHKHPRFYVSDLLSWMIIFTGIFFTLKFFPFREVEYDQYHGRAGHGPYQAVIDHVAAKGGMVFWSNPEAKTRERDMGPVNFSSPHSLDLMKKTTGHTGFACFYEGYRKAGGPGGVWDEMLLEYCSGEREHPAWTIGEMAFHGSEAGGSKKIDEVQTVFLVKKNTPDHILDAMREGRMYALRRSPEYRLILGSFKVAADGGSGEAFMGGELFSPGPVKVSFSVGWEGMPKDRVTASLIRSGEIVKEFDIQSPGELEYTDTFYEPGKKVYYRLDVRGKYPNMLFSNPVFVSYSGEGVNSEL